MPFLDQNLLFGVLALQAGLQDPPKFAEASSAWATRSETALADLLVERGWLTSEERAEVDHLVERKLAKQGSRLAVAGSLPHSRSGATPVTSGMTQPHISLLPARRFEQKQLHATGGMGQVWRAHESLVSESCFRQRKQRNVPAEQPARTWKACGAKLRAVRETRGSRSSACRRSCGQGVL